MKSIRQRVFVSAVAALTGAAAAIGAAGPASATGVSRATSPAPGTCPLGSACLYDAKSYGGIRTSFLNSVSDLRLVRVGDSGQWNADDIATSVYNNGRYQTVRFWQDANFKGPSIDLPRGSGDRYLGDAGGTITKVFDNRISSGKFVAQ